jgi:hypothetical protein
MILILLVIVALGCFAYWALDNWTTVSTNPTVSTWCGWIALIALLPIAWLLYMKYFRRK